MAVSFRCSFLTSLAVLAIVLFAPSARADKPKEPDRAAIRAFIARAEANTQHWTDLAAITLDIALQVPGTDTGRDAVRLYLDALVGLQWNHQPPLELFDQLNTELPKLVAGYCRPDDIAAHPEPCGALIQTQFDLKHGACTIPTTPIRIKTPAEIRAVHIQLAESLVKLWHDVGEPLCAAKNPACPRLAGALNEAAFHFQFLHQTGRAMEIRRLLLDPRYGAEKTGSARGGICDGAKDLDESLLDFPEAASWYERCADDESSSILPIFALFPFRRAIQLRLLLNDEPAARRDMKGLELVAGTINRDHSAWVALTIADHDLRAGRFTDAEAWLEHKKDLLELATDIDVQVLFHTYQARIAVEKGRVERAFAQYGIVRHLWKNATADVKSIEKHPNVQSFETILEAVGEAEFFFGQRSERAVDAIQFPRYRGPIEEKPLRQHMLVHRKLEIGKLKAIEHAAEVYESVLHIEPAAPPRWIIAAANRVGTLWATFADDIENIPKLTGPIPGRDGITYEELRKAYEGAVGLPPWRDRATKAFQFCVQQAERSRHFDKNARHCEQWLAKHSPSARRIVDELQDTPSHTAFGIETRLIDSDL